MSKYAGITIGPIYDTMMEASSPASLWFASSVFSDITRRLCGKISGEVEGAQILSPYYSEDTDLADGIGKFHDRVIFTAPDITTKQLHEITDQVRAEVIEDFAPQFQKKQYIAFLKNYLQIHFCVVPAEDIGEENCILALSPFLDALELMKTFNASDTDNPFLGMFRNGRETPNKKVKDSSLFQWVTKRNQFINSAGEIRSLPEIAEGSGAVGEYSRMKMSHYFAVVSADGDRMTKYLEKLHSPEQITAFSRACLDYNKEAAAMVGRYGGMTIYAGGDDLLFLAPLKGVSEEDKEEDIFALCSAVNKKFHEKIRTGMEKYSVDEALIPTISFGISIQYEKFPLYEARANATKLLGTAKSDESPRNCMMIYLQKHSGQSTAIRVSNDKIQLLEDLLHLGRGNENDTVGTMRTIEDFSEVLKVLEKKAQSEEQFMDAWVNFYDNEGQKPAAAVSGEIGRLYYRNFIADGSSRDAVVIPGAKDTSSIRKLLAILHLRRFSQEKGDETN